jgi:hypothetical protein
MKVEFKVVLDTDEPKDQALAERLIALLEDIREMMDADS